LEDAWILQDIDIGGSVALAIDDRVTRGFEIFEDFFDFGDDVHGLFGLMINVSKPNISFILC